MDLGFALGSVQMRLAANGVSMGWVYREFGLDLCTETGSAHGR
jgi:hypothetical protein